MKLHVLKPEMILYAAYANMVYLVVYLAEIYLSFFVAGAFTAPIQALEIILSIIIYTGWIEVGRKFRNQLMQNVSMVAVWLVPIAGILSVALGFLGPLPTPFIVVWSLAMGLILIVFGFSMLRLKRRFANLAKATGWVDIVAGFCILSVMLMPIALVLMLPMIILETLVLLRAYKKVRKK